MKRDEAIQLMHRLTHTKQTQESGSRTAPYHGYNSWMTFIVKSVKSSWAAIPHWQIPGLFISFEEVKQSTKPYLTVFYKTSCDTLLVLTMPCAIVGGKIVVPNNFKVLATDHNGEPGVKIDIQHWEKIVEVTN